MRQPCFNPEEQRRRGRGIPSSDAASSRTDRDADLWRCAEDRVQRYTDVSSVARAVSLLASDAA